MRMRRKNRGFSLVELIVVVLIMGIIAVALAPQVMKWVGKANEGVDFQTADELKLTGQLAVAEFEYQENVLADEAYNVTSSGVVVADGGTDANSGMLALFEQYLDGVYPRVQSEEGKVFQIQLKAVGSKVTVTTVTGSY